jgi:type III pantothenate kinase
MPENPSRWLALDIGNTQTVAGLFEVDARGAKTALVASARFKTEPDLAAQDWLTRLASLMNPQSRVDRVLVASVVPSVKTALAQAFSGIPWLWIDSSLKRNFELKLPHPEQLGADRLANVAGALARFEPPFVIVDAGTATTFCLVDEYRRYLGGSIVAGMETAFNALAGRAARLFEVEWSRPKSTLGNTTETQLQSGIFQGHEALIEGMTLRLLREGLPGSQGVRRILTGGWGHLLDLSGQGFEFIPTLTLEGLIRLGWENRE